MNSSLDQRCAALAATQYGLITRQQAFEIGLSADAIRHRLERGRWVAVHPGVYAIAGTVSSWEQELLAACLWSRTGAASHRAAARLWGLAGFDRSRRLEITVTSQHQPPRCGIIVHFTGRRLPSDITVVRGIPAVSVERTLLDLGAVVPPTKVAIALDDALCRDLVSTSQLDAYLRQVARRGRRGCAVLRKLLEQRLDSPVVPNSPLETRFFQLLVASGDSLPELQHEIRDGTRLIARVDFAFPDEKLAIEMDGYRFHSGRRAWERDKQRRNELSLLGWRVIEGTWSEVAKEPELLLDRVRRARRRAG